MLQTPVDLNGHNARGAFLLPEGQWGFLVQCSRNLKLSQTRFSHLNKKPGTKVSQDSRAGIGMAVHSCSWWTWSRQRQLTVSKLMGFNKEKDMHLWQLPAALEPSLLQPKAYKQ